MSYKTGRPSGISPRRPTTVPMSSVKGKTAVISNMTQPKVLMETMTTTSSPSAVTHGVGLTILLAPPPHPSPVFPAIFKKYPKVQQLFPYSRLHESPPRPSKKGLDGHEETAASKPGKQQTANGCLMSQLFYL